MTKTGWMIVTSCPCKPDELVTFCQRNMLENNANVGSCGSCSRPLVVLGDNGHLYEIGKCLLENADS